MDRPVSVIESPFRYPPRRRLVETEERNAYVAERALALLPAGQSLLVCVYRKSDAETLARDLRTAADDAAAIDHFHSELQLAERRRMRKRFRDGETRVLVTTTSLKMGINRNAPSSPRGVFCRR